MSGYQSSSTLGHFQGASPADGTLALSKIVRVPAGGQEGVFEYELIDDSIRATNNSAGKRGIITLRSPSIVVNFAMLQ